MSSVFNLCRNREFRHRTPTTFLIGFNLNKKYSTHSSVRGPKPIDSALCAAELLLGHDSLQDLECGIPELVVLSIEQNNETGGLGVKGGWDVEDSVFGDGHNLFV